MVGVQALTAAQVRDLEAVFALLSSGHGAQGLPVAQRLAGIATRSPDAHQALALCHAQMGDVDLAEQAFLRALELAPDQPLILMNFATMLRHAGRNAAAIDLGSRAVRSAPESAKAWTELGLSASAAGQPQQALTALHRAVEIDPGAGAAWNALGYAARATGDLELARAAFETLVALEPAHPSAAINLGTILRLCGRADQAVTCLQKLDKVQLERADIRDTLVGALLDSGRHEEALDLARRVARESPGFIPGLATLTNLLWEYGPAIEDADPFEPFRVAVQQQPGNHELRAAYVRMLLEARFAEDAYKQVRIIREHDDHPMLGWMEANALEMMGRGDQAAALYEQLHAGWGSRMPGFLSSYTRHLLRTGQWDIAALRASEAVQANPADQEAWAYLGTAYRLTGDSREDWLCDYDRLVGRIEIDPPAGYPGLPGFLEALRSRLDAMHAAQREPIQQSLRRGSQTPGRLFGRADPLLATLQSALTAAIERWLATLPDDRRHPFLGRNTGKFAFGGSWSVKLWSSGSHVNHVHTEGWMSSAFYVALPPSVSGSTGDQAGHIQFGQPPIELGLDLPPRCTIRPEEGKLLLFPSYFWHGTVPFEDQQPRMTVAFDMTPRH